MGGCLLYTRSTMSSKMISGVVVNGKKGMEGPLRLATARKSAGCAIVACCWARRGKFF